MCPIILIDIPQLDEDLRPGLRIGAAIKGRKLPGLDFGDMIARPNGVTPIREDQLRIRRD
ncbi:hypothetical protein L905_07280 [Agrobacterium sp. TS43]|nr:hypothetical protein K538_14075 [Agrobacterium tumefaciens GW4]KVK49952.1 hypothetical protein L903_18940 [Agrobacterium sp. JL28]KVK59285.1 hypothetical protein L905_07280 [Agrobacterium sp. TS43]KVK62999.1 hypothetical protein L906_18070 [Agrobacterium sp. TS45]